jgi:hypothetical protein
MKPSSSPDKLADPAPPGDGLLLSASVWRVLLAVVSAAAVYPALMIAPNEYDSCIFEWMGRRMWAGDLPYRDLWDNKFAVLYWINAAAAATGSVRWAIFAMQAAAVAIGGMAIFSLGRRLLGDWPGRLAGLAYVTFAATKPTLMTGNLTETWAAPFVILSIWAMVRYIQDEKCQASWPLVSGLMLGLAAGLRQPAVLVGAVLVVLVPALWRLRRVSPLAVMAWLIGVLLVPLLMLVWARRAGLAEVMWQQCIQFNLAYGSSADLPAWVSWAEVGRRFVAIVNDTLPWHALALAGLVALLFFRPVRKVGEEHCEEGKRQPSGSTSLTAGGSTSLTAGGSTSLTAGGSTSLTAGGGGELPSRILIIVWLVAAGLSALPSLRFYNHHYYLTLAPLSLLIGALWIPFLEPGGPRERARGIAAVALTAVFVLAVAIYFNSWISSAGRLAEWASPTRKAGDFLASRVGRGDTVYVFAWGPESDLLPRLAAPSPTKHVMVLFYPELHNGPQLLAEWQAEMIARPPDWLVCREGMDLVTDRSGPGLPIRWRSAFLWDQPRFGQFADQVAGAYRGRYRQVATFDRGAASSSQPDADRIIVYQRTEMDNVVWPGPQLPTSRIPRTQPSH